MSDISAPLRLEVRNISKRFQTVLANDGVGFSVAPGQIHALLGENGAGKSTIVKIIYGVLQADDGEILWNGRPAVIDSPNTARALGIGMVFQHFSLFEALTVLENIALGLDGAHDLKALEKDIIEMSSRYGFALDPHREIHTLSVGERQRVEIVRCLLQHPKLLIMDEPTSVLTPQEVEKLFVTLRQIAAEGCSILYISHKLHEIKELCHHATVLRAGRVVGECDPAQESARGMAQLMIGSELAVVKRRHAQQQSLPKLTVANLDVPTDEPFGVDLKNISFEVMAGEILGIAGVAGNGQSELMRALSGELPLSAPSMIRLDNKPIGGLNAEERRMLGLCSVPEERNGHTAVPDLSLATNTLLSARHRMGLSQHGIIRKSAMANFARRVIEAYAVKAEGPMVPAGTLSGGNLQKFIVGREIMQEPDVLVIAQPTWGVDAGAAAAIHQALFNLAQSGAGVVVVSQDLDELMAISDRLMVINMGRMSRPILTSEASVEEIGLLMGGVHGNASGEEAHHAA